MLSGGTTAYGLGMDLGVLAVGNAARGGDRVAPLPDNRNVMIHQDRAGRRGYGSGSPCSQSCRTPPSRRRTMTLPVWMASPTCVRNWPGSLTSSPSTWKMISPLAIPTLVRGAARHDFHHHDTGSFAQTHALGNESRNRIHADAQERVARARGLLLRKIELVRHRHGHRAGLPFLRTRRVRLVPGAAAAISRLSCAAEVTGVSSKKVIMSPAARSAAAPGPRGTASVTTTPRVPRRKLQTPADRVTQVLRGDSQVAAGHFSFPDEGFSHILQEVGRDGESEPFGALALRT